MSSGPLPGPREAQEECWEAGWDPEISGVGGGGEARERVPVTPPWLSPLPDSQPTRSSAAGSLSPSPALTSPAGFGGPLTSPVEQGCCLSVLLPPELSDDEGAPSGPSASLPGF
ncbi:unnamed protein product [Rangifer tarandus platyrhynchus]|uniref:Uncharacterized protein n=2 Tax=Rangifer tarandus platyrhynchus TaxID=3082113 RepID=A0ACB0E475_RANTA|nr:unnamed protein product [Rangifer tarandus platyrhynchus]CAI9695432.1 unnamed protein product [Rangifer tarandus platyrhynchus]